MRVEAHETLQLLGRGEAPRVVPRPQERSVLEPIGGPAAIRFFATQTGLRTAR